MSELTRCNFCTMQRLKANADKSGDIVSTRAKPAAGMNEGVTVFIHKPGQEPKQEDFAAWFGALTDHCVC